MRTRKWWILFWCAVCLTFSVTPVWAGIDALRSEAEKATEAGHGQAEKPHRHRQHGLPDQCGICDVPRRRHPDAMQDGSRCLRGVGGHRHDSAGAHGPGRALVLCPGPQNRPRHPAAGTRFPKRAMRSPFPNPLMFMSKEANPSRHSKSSAGRPFPW